MTASIKSLWRKRKSDRKRAYSKKARAAIIIFRLLYSVLVFFSLFYGNVYINLLALAIWIVILLSDIKLLIARIAVRITKLQNKNFRAVKGSRITIKTEIINRFIFNYPVCRVYIDLQEGIVIPEGYDDKLVFALTPFTKNAFRYALYCPYRGQFTVGADTMHVWDDLGIRYIRKKYDGKITLTVYPDILGIRDFDDIKRKEEESLGAVTKDTMDYSDSMEIRDYREQDSMRTIHWKISSRLDKLMTKKYFAAQSRRIRIYFDNSVSSVQISTIARLALIDKLSEVCATVCKFINNERIPFDFIYSSGNDINCFQCDTETDFDGVYYLLASLEFNGENGNAHASLAEYITQYDSSQSVVYIFTANITEKMLYSIKELNYLGFSTALIYVGDEHPEPVLEESVKLLCSKFTTIGINKDTVRSLEEF